MSIKSFIQYGKEVKAMGLNFLYRLMTIVLSPLLIVQAMYVRRTTPSLPEAKGLRDGISGVGNRTSVLIVGDSSAAGVGVATQDQALMGRLVAELGLTHQVSWQLLAKTGVTSVKVLERLRVSPKQTVDYVLLSIGVNDVTSLTKPEESVENLRLIIKLLKTEFNIHHIVVSKVPLMHLFPALPQPLRWWLGRKANKLNECFNILIDNDKQCTLLDIQFPIQNNYIIAEDGFHPGACAYALWGRHVAKIIQKDLSERIC
jgi:lysophospholipase L1-like esterase